jgi:hypothetical protein
VYRAAKEGFVIENAALIPMKEAITRMKKLATGDNVYTFQGAMELPPAQGEYLLRADCTDITKKHPESLVATQSAFLDIMATAKGAIPKGHTVKINQPLAGSKFGLFVESSG